MLTIINQFTEAETKIGKIKGLITGTLLRGENITYEFSYFANAEYKVVWLNESEFNITEENSKKTFVELMGTAKKNI